MDQKITQQFIDTLWEDSIIPTLSEYIKIPNKSVDYDANWEENGFMDEAMTLLVDWCKQHAPVGMKLELLRDPGLTPFLYLEIPASNDDKGTIVFYGHMDKQPEMTGWDADLGPWIPMRKGDKLYGRGGADDGYSVFSAITAILALQKQNIPHARCVILIEASEESGSVHLPHYLQKLQSKIGTPDLVIGLDSGAGNYEQLWMTTSLRGNVVGELSVSLLTEGVHSGMGSGVVADSFRVVRELLSRVEDENTGKILLKSTQANIPEDRILEAQKCTEVLGKISASLPFQQGVKPVTEDPVEMLLNRTWRAALSVTGANGLPAVANAGNVSRPETAVKLSMRIPPEADPHAVAKELKEIFETNPPYNAKVSYTSERSPAVGWNAPKTAEWLKNACDVAGNMFYGKPTLATGEGGTIPFMGMIGAQYPEAQFVITGVLGPNSNAHGPNEFLHIPMAKKLTACVASIVAQHYQRA